MLPAADLDLADAAASSLPAAALLRSHRQAHLDAAAVGELEAEPLLGGLVMMAGAVTLWLPPPRPPPQHEQSSC